MQCLSLVHRWTSSTFWVKGSTVRHGKDSFKAEGAMNAAEPGNVSHWRFYVRFSTLGERFGSGANWFSFASLLVCVRQCELLHQGPAHRTKQPRGHSAHLPLLQPGLVQSSQRGHLAIRQLLFAFQICQRLCRSEIRQRLRSLPQVIIVKNPTCQNCRKESTKRYLLMR